MALVSALTTEGNTERRGLRIRLKILETVVEVGEGVDGVHEARVLGVVKIDELGRGGHVCGMRDCND